MSRTSEDDFGAMGESSMSNIPQNNLAVEVTPEMEEAGFRVLSDSGISDVYLEADKLLVSEIFLAMLAKYEEEKAPSRGTCKTSHKSG